MYEPILRSDPIFAITAIKPFLGPIILPSTERHMSGMPLFLVNSMVATVEKKTLRARKIIYILWKTAQMVLQMGICHR